MTKTTPKASARRCRYCGAEIPPQPSGPGRPRVFCSRRCRRDWHSLKEHFERRRDVEDSADERAYARDLQWYGKRRADKLARDRAKEREARERQIGALLEAP